MVTYGITSLCGESVGLHAWSSNEHPKTMTIAAQGAHVSQTAFSYALVNAPGAKTANISSVPWGTQEKSSFGVFIFSFKCLLTLKGRCEPTVAKEENISDRARLRMPPSIIHSLFLNQNSASWFSLPSGYRLSSFVLSANIYLISSICSHSTRHWESNNEQR